MKIFGKHVAKYIIIYYSVPKSRLVWLNLTHSTALGLPPQVYQTPSDQIPGNEPEQRIDGTRLIFIGIVYWIFMEINNKCRISNENGGIAKRTQVVYTWKIRSLSSSDHFILWFYYTMHSCSSWDIHCRSVYSKQR